MKDSVRANPARVQSHRGKSGSQTSVRPGTSIRNDNLRKATIDSLFLLRNLDGACSVTQASHR
jgi:hypothetical protein